MAVLEILKYPHERLKIVAEPVEKVDDEIKQLIQDMAETMYQANGIGLAATQVDRHIRLLVIDISTTKDQLQVFINPELVEGRGEEIGEEGCLSVPDIREKVTRFAEVVVEALDENGEKKRIEADDILAVCLQHEMDHLNGTLFVDHLSRLKRSRIQAKLKKAKRLEKD